MSRLEKLTDETKYALNLGQEALDMFEQATPSMKDRVAPFMDLVYPWDSRFIQRIVGVQTRPDPTHAEAMTAYYMGEFLPKKAMYLAYVLTDWHDESGLYPDPKLQKEQIKYLLQVSKLSEMAKDPAYFTLLFTSTAPGLVEYVADWFVEGDLDPFWHLYNVIDRLGTKDMEDVVEWKEQWKAKLVLPTIKRLIDIGDIDRANILARLVSGDYKLRAAALLSPYREEPADLVVGELPHLVSDTLQVEGKNHHKLIRDIFRAGLQEPGNLGSRLARVSLPQGYYQRLKHAIFDHQYPRFASWVEGTDAFHIPKYPKGASESKLQPYWGAVRFWLDTYQITGNIGCIDKAWEVAKKLEVDRTPSQGFLLQHHVWKEIQQDRRQRYGMRVLVRPEILAHLCTFFERHPEVRDQDGMVANMIHSALYMLASIGDESLFYRCAYKQKQIIDIENKLRSHDYLDDCHVILIDALARRGDMSKLKKVIQELDVISEDNLYAKIVSRCLVAIQLR